VNRSAADVFTWIRRTWLLMVCQTSPADSLLMMSTFHRFSVAIEML